MRHSTSVRAVLGLLCATSALLGAQPTAVDETTLRLPGLKQPVEIVRDHWGINHIYAKTEHDLFFAQGWAAAKDRLFQFEVWRRQATGTVAEWLGPRELDRDIGARLFRFRGDLTAELQHYHPRGRAIITAFVDGINAYVIEARRDPARLPIEFRILNILPGLWTPEVVISRHQGLLGNITEELDYGRMVAALGPARVKALQAFRPGNPDLTLAPGIDSGLLAADILKLYNAFRGPLRFRAEDIAPAYRMAHTTGLHNVDPMVPSARRMASDEAGVTDEADPIDWSRERLVGGSNNWIVSGRLSQSGAPLLANDPHRAISVPSLRYFAHLVGPGWNVIGGGEPVLPGISIGHNQYGAWGLTIFETDGEDLLVYETDPANADRYRYRGQWEPMRVIADTIQVKAQRPAIVRHRYTRHGPVVYQDTVRHRAFAVRAAWLEPGGAPYLSSLRIDQATTWGEFRAANRYGHIPGENMIWADRTGHIGWQAVGIAPRRPNFSGLVPVPGDGRYEWNGFLDILQKPHILDPAEGFLATANQDNVPRGFPAMDAIGFTWASPHRWARATEVLGSGRRFSLMDMSRLQTDELSLPARELTRLLRDVAVLTPRLDSLRRRLLLWDHVLAKESVEAGIYVAWERRLTRLVYERLVAPAERAVMPEIPFDVVLRAVAVPDGTWGPAPLMSRDALLVQALSDAEASLRERFGAEVSDWAYGRSGYKHVMIRHVLSGLVADSLRVRLDVGPAPRGGYGLTLNANGSGDNQTSGASFRIAIDLADWDLALGTNTPGQSGDPASPFYRDLFGEWARDRYFPVLYTRPKIDAATASRTRLTPY